MRQVCARRDITLRSVGRYIINHSLVGGYTVLDSEDEYRDMPLADPGSTRHQAEQHRQGDDSDHNDQSDPAFACTAASLGMC